MGLEAANYISELDSNNPEQTDLKREGDNHIRMIKEVLQNTFPGANRAFRLPTASYKTAHFSIAASESNTVFWVDTSATTGSVNASLPSLTSGQAGWSCQFIKHSHNLVPLLVYSPIGLIYSGQAGVAYVRRCIPGSLSTATWTGTAWYITRVPGAPVGACLEYHGQSLPVGYEWPSTQTLSTTYYPEYAQLVHASGATLDRNERVAAMVDRLGVSRIYNVMNGDTFGAANSAIDMHQLTVAEMPSHAHPSSSGSLVSTSNPGDHRHFGVINQGSDQLDVVNTHPMAYINALGIGNFIYRLGWNSGQTEANTSPSSLSGGHTHTGDVSVSVAAQGSSGYHNNLQPTIMTNFILVVE